jgi:hypothetical protein
MSEMNETKRTEQWTHSHLLLLSDFQVYLPTTPAQA